jgi:hypothetical protein
MRCRVEPGMDRSKRKHLFNSDQGDLQIEVKYNKKNNVDCICYKLQCVFRNIYLQMLCVCSFIFRPFFPILLLLLIVHDICKTLENSNFSGSRIVAKLLVRLLHIIYHTNPHLYTYIIIKKRFVRFLSSRNNGFQKKH